MFGKWYFRISGGISANLTEAFVVFIRHGSGSLLKTYSYFLLHVGFLFGLQINPENGGDMFTATSVIFQKTELFMNTAAIT
jgi:hypothetical protein